MADYSEVLPIILKAEGGDVNDPDDPGRATRKGVTQEAYDAWRVSVKLPKQSVFNMSDAECSDVYKTRYWDVIKGDLLPDQIALVLFDCAVNQGAGYAAKLLQWAVKVPQDGVIGQGTLKAVAAKNDSWLAEDLIWARHNRYLATCRAWRAAKKPNPYKYIDGWNNRLDALRDILLPFR